MWDLLQTIEINDLRQRQSDMDSSQRSVGADIRDLEKLLYKMALVNQALYELLKSKTGITDEDLRRKIKEIDIRNGEENGRLDASPLRCPKCGNTMTAGALKCPSCSATVAPKYPFNA